MGFIGKLASAVLPGVTKIIDDAVPDKDLRAKLKTELQQAALEGRLVEMKAARDIIVAEAGGESWLQRNWRPITMLVFVFIILNNYVLAPYVAAFGGHVPTLDIPNGMWALLNVGIGGYIASRGIEKTASKLGKRQ